MINYASTYMAVALRPGHRRNRALGPASLERGPALPGGRQNELLVVGAGGRGHDRGDDQKARPRDGLSAEVRDGLLLGLLEVRVGAGGVVGDVDDAVDLGDSLGDRYFDALAEGDCGHAAALTPPA